MATVHKWRTRISITSETWCALALLLLHRQPRQEEAETTREEDRCSPALAAASSRLRPQLRREKPQAFVAVAPPPRREGRRQDHQREVWCHG